MLVSRRIGPHSLVPAARGFTLIEVLIAILVLGFGLLGFALLQTMGLRFVQSANQRTHATNLAYDLLDQMRANRYQAAWYSNAGFAAGSVTAGNCSRPVGNVSINQSVTRWRCQVVQALGESASATVNYAGGLVTVSISWGDQRWDANEPDALTTFTMTTQL